MLADDMSTSSTTGADSFSALLLLASSSFVATVLTIGEEEEGPAAEEECMPFFFIATDEAGMTFFPEVILDLFLNPGGHTRTSSTSTVTATGDEGVATEEGVNHPVPRSLR